MLSENDVKLPKLILQSFMRLFLTIIIFCLALFLSAGSFEYWNPWIFIGAFFLSDLYIIIYLIIRDRKLLQKRLKIKEKEKTQKIFNALYYFIVMITLVMTGFNFRFNWSIVPLWLVILSTVIMILGYFLSFIVLKQNSYASRVIEIQKDQKIIDTGLYSVVRHPMYLSALLIFCSIPLILGSFYTFIFIILFTPILLVVRILNEEKVLKKELAGYKEYMNKVKYRIIPFLW